MLLVVLFFLSYVEVGSSGEVWGFDEFEDPVMEEMSFVKDGIVWLDGIS